MTRTHRFLGGVSLGYVYLALVTLVGLWLTPFLLGRVGAHDYGLWLVTTQILGYLALLDLGVVALAPREIAYATGRTLGGSEPDGVAITVGRFRRIVVWQLLPVSVACALCWWAVSARWPALGGPLAAILVAFVAAFPLRLSHAALQGLQDLAFLGKVQLAAWITGTLVTVGLVLAGVGLWALAAGSIAMQLVTAAVCRLRLPRRFPQAWPAQSASVSWTDAKALLARSGWISVAQIGQVFLNGSDILVIGAVFGPAATVPYACTGKLITVLANHPQLLMQTAAPALAELRMSAGHHKLADVSGALTRAMLVISGGVASVVIAVNGAFVSWWVGPDQFAGFTLTALLVITMLLRHLSMALTYTLFAFGHERRISLTAIGDGCLTLVATGALALTSGLGIASAAVGSLAGVLLVSLPVAARAVSRELDITLWTLLEPLSGWAVRFAAAVTAAVVCSKVLQPAGLPAMAMTAGLVGAVYVGLMLPLLMKPPLGAYLRAAAAPIVEFLARRQALDPEPRP